MLGRRDILLGATVLAGASVLESAGKALGVVTSGTMGSTINRPIGATRQGRVQGLQERGASVFRGLRYGASTAGTNRFKPPQPLPSWKGLFDASAFGPQCPQPD